MLMLNRQHSVKFLALCLICLRVCVSYYIYPRSSSSSSSSSSSNLIYKAPVCRGTSVKHLSVYDKTEQKCKNERAVYGGSVN